MAVTWTDEQLAATIWGVFTFAPWLMIEGWVRWNRLLDRIAAAGAALVLFAGEGTLADRQETESADARDTDLRADPSRAPVDGDQGL
jgi:hypothetical protein